MALNKDYMGDEIYEKTEIEEKINEIEINNQFTQADKDEMIAKTLEGFKKMSDGIISGVLGEGQNVVISSPVDDGTGLVVTTTHTTDRGFSITIKLRYITETVNYVTGVTLNKSSITIGVDNLLTDSSSITVDDDSIDVVTKVEIIDISIS